MPTAEEIAQLRVGLEAQREEIANRVVPDPNCTACERKRSIGLHEEGWQAEPHLFGWLRPCASCATRRPFRWVAKIPLPALEAYLVEHWDEAFAIDSLRSLVPEEPRGSSRFEFL